MPTALETDCWQVAASARVWVTREFRTADALSLDSLTKPLDGAVDRARRELDFPVGRLQGALQERFDGRRRRDDARPGAGVQDAVEQAPPDPGKSRDRDRCVLAARGGLQRALLVLVQGPEDLRGLAGEPGGEHAVVGVPFRRCPQAPGEAHDHRVGTRGVRRAEVAGHLLRQLARLVGHLAADDVQLPGQPVEQVHGAVDVERLLAVGVRPVGERPAGPHCRVRPGVRVPFREPGLQVACPRVQVCLVVVSLGAAQLDRGKVPVVGGEHQVRDRVMLVAGQQHAPAERRHILVKLREPRLNRRDDAGLAGSRRPLDQHDVPGVDRQIDRLNLGRRRVPAQDGPHAGGERVHVPDPADRVGALVRQQQAQLAGGDRLATGYARLGPRAAPDADLVERKGAREHSPGRQGTGLVGLVRAEPDRPLASHLGGADDGIACLVVLEGHTAAGLKADRAAADPGAQGLGAVMLDELELQSPVTEKVEAVIVGPPDLLRRAARRIALEAVVLFPDRQVGVVCLREPPDLLPVR